MATSEGRIRMVQGERRSPPEIAALPGLELGLPFAATGGGADGNITVYPAGHPQGISGPDFLAEIQEDARLRPLGRERRVTPGPEFSGRSEFDARGMAAQMGPPRPLVPGDIAGPGAEDQITNAQVAQFLGRMPYRPEGRGPGDSLEGVRIQDPRRMRREAPPAQAKTPPTVGVTKPGPEDQFGQARQPMDRALASREAAREQARGDMEQMIAARRAGEDAARAKGFKSRFEQQQAGMERAGMGHRLAGDWVRRMEHKYQSVADATFLENLYEQYSKDENGNQKTHAETVKAIAQSGALEKLQTRAGMQGAPAPLVDRRNAVAANAKQYHEARKMAGPQGRAMLANTMIGAQNPFDLARAAAGAHALDPNAGWGNLAMGMGAEAANAEAMAGLGEGRQTPVQKMQADRLRVQQMPVGQRAQGYRDMYRAQNAGQPMNPEQENVFLVNEGIGEAGAAAAAVIAGQPDQEGMAFLREWTNSFTAAGEGTTRPAYEKWRRRLGLQHTQESLQLWANLTGVNVKGAFEWNVPSARPPAAGEARPAPAIPDAGGPPMM